jgi:hypothetical protein
MVNSGDSVIFKNSPKSQIESSKSHLQKLALIRREC